MFKRKIPHMVAGLLCLVTLGMTGVATAQTGACATPTGKTVTITAANSWKCLQKQDATQTRIESKIDAIGKLIQQVQTPAPTPAPTPTPVPENPPPAPNGGAFLPPPAAAQLVLNDTIVLPGEHIANVSIRLARPVGYQVTWGYTTKNGDEGPTKAYQDGHFRAAAGTVTFFPGETEKVIPVTILTDDLGQAFFYFEVSWSQNSPPVSGAIARIKGGTTRPPYVAAPVPSFRTPARTTGRTLALDENFLGPLSTTGEAGKWWTRFAWGDQQSGNGEVMVYAAQATHPNINPHPIINGQRHMLLGVGPTASVAGSTAGQISPMWGSMIQGEKVYSITNGYQETRLAVSGDGYCVPALWQVTGYYGQSSYAEADWFEYGLGGTLNASETVHVGNSWVEGVRLPFLPDGKFHTYGIDISPEEQVLYIDGVIVHRRPNPFPNQSFPGLIYNIGSGGALGPAPNYTANPNYKCEITLDYLRVWK